MNSSEHGYEDVDSSHVEEYPAHDMPQISPVVAEFSELRSLLADGGDRFGVSTVCLDTHEELLWVGNQGGHVTSYYGPDMQKYTSFQIHSTNDVRQLLTTDAGILALTRNTLRCQARHGLSIFNYSDSSLKDMQCMLLTSPETLLMGGHQDKIIELDLTRVEECRKVETDDASCAILRQHSRYICTGDPNGKISLRDPHSLSVEHVIEAHDGILSDFDVHGNHLVTCGFSNRLGQLTVDPFVAVYDLRAMRSVAPIEVLLDPLLLRFVPAFTLRLAVVSQTGQFQLVEMGALSETPMCIYQVGNAGSILTFDVSSSNQTLAFGDAGGYVHTFGSSANPSINPYSQPTEFAESIEPIPPIDINDPLTPLASVPMPFSSGKLLSDWPAEFCKVVYRRPPQIDPQIIQSMKIVQSIGYAPNPPGRCLRNQVPYKLSPRKSRQRLTSRDSTKGEDPYLPKKYQKIEVKYSRMGPEDFDYNFYNRSSFSGLESNIPNSYCNAVIQALYFLEPLYAALLNHLCDKEFCLSCELGFLFHMLDISKGMPCQASNFLRAFRTVPEASALGLILASPDDGSKKANLCPLIQSWNRFILQQIHTDTIQDQDVEQDGETSGAKFDSVVSRLFGTEMDNQNRCRCGQEQHHDTTTLLFSLAYPDITPSAPGRPCMQYTFGDVLKRSVCLEQNTQAWCDKCEKFQPTSLSRRVKKLPDIFAINCGMDSKQDLNFWQAQTELLVTKDLKSSNEKTQQKLCRYGRTCNMKGCKFRHENATKRGSSSNAEHLVAESQPTWLPPGFRVKHLEGGKVDIHDITDLTEQREDDGSIEYHLVSLVNHVQDPKKPEHQNLVSFVRVGESYHRKTMGGAISQWYLFNDFVVVPVCLEELLSFDADWKLPCFLYYARKDILARQSVEVKSPITQDVFLEDKSLATRTGYRKITFSPLGIDEMLGADDLVAMDAEFVSLNPEESELRSDGTRSTIKPSQMAVGRITCIRGQGPNKGTPFIDDYISTQDQVVDYLTKFSGIMPGDLDATLSSKHLTTLKSTYTKLRFLIDNGVKFVGHGLKTDFRVINLVVPPDQVIDTVYLFHHSHQRMISLRFLAWHFLGLKIQSIIHDSIEDSRTALKLYERYLDLEKDKQVKEALKALYKEGRTWQWRVPGIED